MKKSSVLPATVLLAALCVLPAGCLFKPSTVTTRSFVLSPVAAPGTTASTNQPALGIGRVKMPSYLQRSAMVMRKGTNEIEYVESALWAERLDQAFQRAFAANLARLVPTDEIRLTDWLPSEVSFTVQVTVDQFDLDASGRGTLVAWWRVSSPGAKTVLRSGESRLEVKGVSPARDPQAAVTALNELVGVFSQEVAQVVRDCAAGSAAQK